MIFEEFFKQEKQGEEDEEEFRAVQKVNGMLVSN
jgi:hypothetical protein